MAAGNQFPNDPAAIAQMQAAQMRGAYEGNASGSESVSEDENPLKGQPLNKFAPPDVRSEFIQKVYALLSIMLVTTTVVAAPFTMLTDAQVIEYAPALQGLMMGSLVLTLCMSCCCMEAMRHYPTNYLFLAIFSVLYGVIIGCVTMRYTIPSVLLAAGITAGIFFSLTAYACTTKSDFTGMGPYLLCALFGLIMFSFMSMFLSFFFPGLYSWARLIQAGLGAILFSFYIVYDTQMIVGGTHSKYQYSVDDYAFGALSLYLDIINLFMYILALFGERK